MFRRRFKTGRFCRKGDPFSPNLSCPEGGGVVCFATTSIDWYGDMGMEIVADVNLIARCGLYCGACDRYLEGKCPGCGGNEKATWCQVRSCNGEKGSSSCAECDEFGSPLDCKKYNNLLSKVIGFFRKSDRSRCIAMIKEKGQEEYAAHMARNRIRTFPPGQ